MLIVIFQGNIFVLKIDEKSKGQFEKNYMCEDSSKGDFVDKNGIFMT